MDLELKEATLQIPDLAEIPCPQFGDMDKYDTTGRLIQRVQPFTSGLLATLISVKLNLNGSTFHSIIVAQMRHLKQGINVVKKRQSLLEKGAARSERMNGSPNFF